jgi:Meckelin (Transmembrane protein 67)
MVIRIVIKMYVWVKYNPQTFDPTNYCSKVSLRFIILVIETYAFGMFFFLMFSVGYLFIFFKFQTKVYTFFPDLADDPIKYWLYRIFFWTDIVCLMSYLLIQIYEQSSVDFYIVDWEKQKISNDVG